MVLAAAWKNPNSVASAVGLWYLVEFRLIWATSEYLRPSNGTIDGKSIGRDTNDWSIPLVNLEAVLNKCSFKLILNEEWKMGRGIELGPWKIS